MAGLRTPITITGTYTPESALVKNADGSTISSPVYQDCVYDAGLGKWLCSNEAPNGTYGAGSQQFRLKGSNPLVVAYSLNGSTVSGATTPAAPAITSLTPSTAKVGDAVAINGTNLSNATSVQFGTISVTPASNTDTKIMVTVPVGATTSLLSVTTSHGTDSRQFTLQQAAGAKQPKVIYGVNSLIAGTTYPTPATTAQGLWPSAWGYYNFAQNGQGISWAIQNIQTQVFDHINTTTDKVVYVIIQEGTNEITDYAGKIQQYRSLLTAKASQLGLPIKLILHTIPPHTEVNATQASLQLIKDTNKLFTDNPGNYADLVVDLYRNNKVAKFGAITDPTDPAYSSNSAVYYEADHIHWKAIPAQIVGYMDWDALNFLENGIAIPDPANYPPGQVLPGQPVTWQAAPGVTYDQTTTELYPTNPAASQFGTGTYGVEAIPLPATSGFAGAFQCEIAAVAGRNPTQPGLFGIGSNTGFLPDYSGIEEGFYDQDAFSGHYVNKGGQKVNTSPVPETTGDELRVEVYVDLANPTGPGNYVVFLRNQQEVGRRTGYRPTFPLYPQISFTGTNFTGIKNARIELP